MKTGDFLQFALLNSWNTSFFLVGEIILVVAMFHHNPSCDPSTTSPRSQEGILQRELTGLRTQLSALDTRSLALEGNALDIIDLFGLFSFYSTIFDHTCLFWFLTVDGCWMISMFYYFFLVGYSALFASGFDDSWPGLSQEYGWIHLQKTAKRIRWEDRRIEAVSKDVAKKNPVMKNLASWKIPVAMIHGGGRIAGRICGIFCDVWLAERIFCGFKGGDSPPTMRYLRVNWPVTFLLGGKIILYTCLGLEGLRSG